MPRIRNVYLRARTYRLRKAIIYSMCTGVVLGLAGCNPVHLLLAMTAVWIVTWWYTSQKVDDYRNIISLEGKNGRKS